MAQSASRKKKVLVVVLAVVVAVIVAITGFAANFLVDFAINPKAELFMGKTLADGSGATGESLADADYAAEARAWFEGARQDVTLVAEDGTELGGWTVSQAGESHLYLVACHGYSSQPASMSKYAYHFYQRGYNVLLPTARAHEKNADTGLIQMGWQDSRDLVSWVNQIVGSDPEARIVLFGVSMGGAEVMMASGWGLPSNVRAIVEDCGYSSVWDEFALQLDDLFGLPAFPLLNVASAVSDLRAGYSFEEASAVAQLNRASVPMLFIHGDADTFVPFSMLQVVYDACASEDKQMLVVEGAAHARSASTNPELYWQTVDAFVDSRV